MKVRTAEPRDAEAIAHVHVASWQGAYRGLLPSSFLDSLSVERRAEFWNRILGNADVDVFVALDAGETIVGFASIHATRDSDATPGTGELGTIYVLPEAWGQGYGRALMDAALDRAVERGFAVLTVWVLEANERAKRFYQIAGFEADGAAKTETFQGDVVLDEVRFRMDLTGRRPS